MRIYTSILYHCIKSFISIRKWTDKRGERQPQSSGVSFIKIIYGLFKTKKNWFGQRKLNGSEMNNKAINSKLNIQGLYLYYLGL